MNRNHNIDIQHDPVVQSNRCELPLMVHLNSTGTARAGTTYRLRAGTRSVKGVDDDTRRQDE
ncbi:MAG: hypothetical protein MK179_13035 [Pirellulaceae bacterium]|nr:hypothetical protein [Pirellulaceae bacterium]